MSEFAWAIIETLLVGAGAIVFGLFAQSATRVVLGFGSGSTETESPLANALPSIRATLDEFEGYAFAEMVHDTETAEVVQNATEVTPPAILVVMDEADPDQSLGPALSETATEYGLRVEKVRDDRDSNEDPPDVVTRAFLIGYGNPNSSG